MFETFLNSVVAKTLIDCSNDDQSHLNESMSKNYITSQQK